MKGNRGETPFLLGLDRMPVVRLLLKDPRVDVTLGDHRGYTPLWHAASNAQL